MTDTDTFIYPRRLVFLQMGNNCMFCEHPQGSSYLKHVAIEIKVGYIYCDDCEAKADETIKKWNDEFSYGKAHYLKDREIKVLRSNGEIEGGWRLNNPLIDINHKGKFIICCSNEAKQLEKWCFLDTILELNPN
jgi:transcription elongation factor Elf1